MVATEVLQRRALVPVVLRLGISQSEIYFDVLYDAWKTMYSLSNLLHQLDVLLDPVQKERPFA